MRELQAEAEGWRVGAKMLITHLLPANFLGDFNALVHSEASITRSGSNSSRASLFYGGKTVKFDSAANILDDLGLLT